MERESPAGKILRLRKQILIHSCIYYVLNDSVISDYDWSQKAKELCALQDEYPDISKEVPWYEAFKDFDPSTGYNLPIRDPYVIDEAQWILEYHKSQIKHRS